MLYAGARKRVVAAVVAPLMLAAVVVYGCGSDRPPPGSDGTNQARDDGCLNGQVRTCHRVISEQAGVRNCASGTQVCTGNAWGPCISGENGTITALVLSHPTLAARESNASGGLATRSLSAPSATSKACQQDPCDPDCVGFDECGDGGAGSPFLGMCNGGANNGNLCQRAADCSGGSCAPITGMCVGGPQHGTMCANTAACLPGGSCITPFGVCVGGPKNGDVCSSASHCPGAGATCTPGFGACIGGSQHGNLCRTASQCPGPGGTCVHAGAASDAGCPITTGIPTGDAGGATFIGVTGTSGIPAAQLNRLWQDDGRSFGSECDEYPSGSVATSKMFSACQADAWCFADTYDDLSNGRVPLVPYPSGGSKQFCNRFTAGQHYNASVCATFDLTAAPGCTSTGTVPAAVPAGNSILPICNRGAGPFPGAVGVGILVTNPSGSGLPRAVGPSTCFPTTTPTCTVTLPPIAPGACAPIDLGATACGNLSGTRFVAINNNGAVTECGLDPASLHPPLPSQGVQLGCTDNWTASNWSSNPGCTQLGVASTSSTYTQTYSAICSPGTRAQWSHLTYNASLPSNASGSSEIVFSVASAPRLVDGGVGVYTAPQQIADACNVGSNCDPAATPPQGDPALCAMSGPSACSTTPGPKPPCCPKDIYAKLFSAGGITAARNENLKLTIVFNPSPNGLVTPSLLSWQVTYSCVPAE